MSETQDMTSNPIGLPAPTGSTTGTGQVPNNLNLTASDFVKMMITQLQNQDPLNPTDSGQMMQQMSEIGQMQSTTQLQTTLSTLGSQTQIGAASSLLGKKVTGIDATNNTVSGLVSSVQVNSSGVNLLLDSGSTLPLSGVTGITPAPVATTGQTAGTTGA
jgi:flagellar basal-body rod modification protein FlgD